MPVDPRRAGNTFKMLDVGDFIYRINPFTLKVEGLKIKDIKGIHDRLVAGKHPNAYALRHWVEIIVFMPEPDVHSPDIDLIPTIKIWVDGSLNACLTVLKNQDHQQMPIPIAASRKLLEEWMAK